MRTVRRFTPWIAASLLLSILLPRGPDNDLRFSSAYAQENQPTFIGGVLNPLAFNQPITAVEIPEERTEKSAVFDLGGRKRAAVSSGEPLFVQKNNEWIPIEENGHFDGHSFVFDRLAEDVEIRFDLAKPQYTLMQNGQGFSVAFAAEAEGRIINNRSVAYVLADGATLTWTVNGNHVHKEILIGKRGIADDIAFTDRKSVV